MKNSAVIFLIATTCFTACSKPAAPAASNPPDPAPQQSGTPKTDAVQQKLLEYSGPAATDCGRLNVQAGDAQLTTASGCAMQASQNKRAFYVAYDMPGMTVGVAGNGEGKLFTVQSQGGGPAPAVTSGACPSALRVAASGRISCFAPGDMMSMGESHAGRTITPPAGAGNPHARPNPHTTAAPKTQ